MIIKSFSILHRYSVRAKSFAFDSSIEYFFSYKNSVGKTTFLRAILYSLGFPIPSTKHINFEQYSFTIEVLLDNSEQLTIERNGNLISANGLEYNCQTDFAAIVQRIFGLDNYDLIINLLAVIYIDQDKGWTLLNRGKVIGSNSFNIESFLRGLNNKSVIELQARLKSIDYDINRYTLMLNVADYQKTLEEHKEEISEISFDDSAEAEIGILQNKIDQLDKEIRLLTSVKKQNSEFVDYITRLGLQVQIDGKNYIINKNNLLNFNDIQAINDLRLTKMKNERNELVTKKARLLDRIKPNAFFETTSVIDSFDQAISRNKVDSLQVKSILDSLQKERESVRESISKATIENNTWIPKLNVFLKQYWEEMGVELDYRDSYLFTRDLKSLSGALLYKIIVAFKLAYMRILYEKTNLLFPIFIDSPTGREVKPEIVEKALNLVKRDFSKHQLFLSSVINYEHIFGCNEKSKLAFDELKVFDPITLFDQE